VRLLTVLLKLGGDNEGKRKAAQYPEKIPERDHLYDGKSFYVCRIQHGNISHATGKVEYDVDGTFLYSLNLLPLTLCESKVPDRDTVF